MPAPSKTTTAATISGDASPGGIYADNGACTTDGAGNFSIASLALSMSAAAAQALATGTAVILIPTGQSIVRVSAAAATTGASLPVGPARAMLLLIEVTSAVANTITFAAAGTSNVAGGAAISLSGPGAHLFMWDNVGLLWYQVGPAAN